MKLYMHPLSSNARRVRLVAHHLGLPLDEVLVDLATGAQRQPSYLAINPNGKVPTLVDGDLKLWECSAIMIYLSEKSGKRALYPEDLAARTEVNRWLFWGANEWSPVIRILNQENMIKQRLGLGGPDPVRVQEAEKALAPLTKVLDDHLAAREYVLGSQLSLADFALGASLASAVPAKLPISGYANIQAWFGRIQKLPAWESSGK